MRAVLVAGLLRCCAVALVIALESGHPSAQMADAPGASGFPPAEELALGRTAAGVLRTGLPILRDAAVREYVHALGQRLVYAIPAELRQPHFDFDFPVVNVQELTTIGLPGGPLFISRGMIELAGTEGALAGILAHEMSHIVLRHASAQAMESERYQIGAITGRMIGAAAAGRQTGTLERSADFAVASHFLVYELRNERQADLLAAAIVTRAGYDARHLAAMVQRVVHDGAARGGLLWGARHGCREYAQCAARIEALGRTSADAVGPRGGVDDPLLSIQGRLAAVPPVPWRQYSPDAARLPLGTGGRGVLAPSRQAHTVRAGDLLELRVPDNWERLPAGNTVVFAPEAAYVRTADGPTAVTHGVQIAVARSPTGALETDVQALLAALAPPERPLQWRPPFSRLTVAGRPGLSATAISSATGQFEHVSVAAAHLPDGSFVYLVGVAPEEEAGVYRSTFNSVVGTLRIVR